MPHLGAPDRSTSSCRGRTRRKPTTPPRRPVVSPAVRCGAVPVRCVDSTPCVAAMVRRVQRPRARLVLTCYSARVLARRHLEAPLVEARRHVPLRCADQRRRALLRRRHAAVRPGRTELRAPAVPASTHSDPRRGGQLAAVPLGRGSGVRALSAGRRRPSRRSARGRRWGPSSAGGRYRESRRPWPRGAPGAAGRGAHGRAVAAGLRRAVGRRRWRQVVQLVLEVVVLLRRTRQ
jgi:hypothetical protein